MKTHVVSARFTKSSYDLLHQLARESGNSLADEIEVRLLRTAAEDEARGYPVLEGTAMSEPHEPILQFFTHSHLPQHLSDVSRPFAELANRMVQELPRNPERTVALRKLLEAKDAAVRARLFR